MKEVFCTCPYCGESISLLIAPDSIDQSYIEDCEVCCRPMTVQVMDSGDDEFMITLFHENEVP